MSSLIVSRQTIALQAARAAQLHTPDRPAQNPYDPALEPEHHECWKADFARALHESVPESEGSA